VCKKVFKYSSYIDD
jgi:hypothetical protein